MANKIQIKRGLQANLPTLDVGEPALTTNSGSEKVYIGTGSGNKEMPTLVGGVLPVTKGGTGQSTLALTRNAMGLGNTTGALPVANGGTGTTTLALARNAMGLGNTTGALPVANGGTGSTTASGAKANIGLGNVLNYGIATKAEAEAGTSNVKYMTPLRVKEAIDKFGIISTPFELYRTTGTLNQIFTINLPSGWKYVRFIIDISTKSSSSYFGSGEFVFYPDGTGWFINFDVMSNQDSSKKVGNITNYSSLQGANVRGLTVTPSISGNILNLKITELSWTIVYIRANGIIFN